MSGSSEIDSIINEVLSETGRVITEDFPPREAKLERLPSIPILVPPDEPPDTALPEKVPTMITVMYENGSISYINLKSVPVIQRTLDDTYLLMWPDTANGVLLKALYIFHRTGDPIAYRRIEAYLASRFK